MIYLPIEKDMIPEEFQIELGAERFVMGINYNEDHDFFTVDLYDQDREPIVLGEQLRLNKPLWSDLSDSRLPAPTLIPTGQEEKITYDNFMVTTFLIVDQEADEDGDTII
ncbi:hypothetical protein AWH48_11585 [Domibacillus aminovorans]|uniref:Cyanophage baseplate Pam3 plug gp18 domain-containing protein n=1 Tax=Domibacillus aminovorans TaxID=29332 RepID=A0A177KKL6_9BACI|nr:hypothetical protein [Domibacillus aminovorans]OAH53903.1 hypothetical protein AWH48_11585 [Domibacillus aminovorans]